MTDEIQVYPMRLKDDYFVCLANDLILGQQRGLSLWANRIIHFLIMQILPDDDIIGTYQVKITDLANFLGIWQNGSLYQNIQDACDELLQVVIKIRDKKNPKSPWKMFHWVDVAEYDGKGTLTFKLSDEIKPYLVQLIKVGFFTKYSVSEILPMTSFYAIRLYQFISLLMTRGKEHEHERYRMQIDELRGYLDCSDKYDRISQFKDKVIDVALLQINSNPNSIYHIEVEYIRFNRRIDEIILDIIYIGGVGGNKIKYTLDLPESKQKSPTTNLK